MVYFAAARSVLRTSTSGSRLSAAMPKPSSSTFRLPRQTQNRLSRTTSFRSVMASSRCLGSILPYHTATASSLLTSMLSVANRNYIWTHEDGP